MDNDNYDYLREPGLLSPQNVPFPGMFGKTVVMLPVEHDLRLFRQAMGFTGAPKKLFCAQIYLNSATYPHVALCGSFIGAPQAVMLLEVLAAKGADTFVFCGLCGALDASVGIGSLFAAQSAFSDDGTAKHYSAKQTFAADSGMHERLENLLANGGYSYTSAKMASIDAIFRETKSKIKFYRQKSCIALDMETAALYAAASYRKLKICGLYAVSDMFDGDVWRSGFGSAKLKKARAHMLEIVKELLRDERA